MLDFDSCATAPSSKIKAILERKRNILKRTRMVMEHSLPCGVHDTSYDRTAHRAIIGHNDADFYSPMKTERGGLVTASSTGRRSEIRDGFLKNFKPSQTSFHPGGKGMEFIGQPSMRSVTNEVDWGSETFARYKARKSIGKQILSNHRNATSFKFGTEEIPDEFGGRGAFSKMPMSYGTMR